MLSVPRSPQGNEKFREYILSNPSTTRYILLIVLEGNFDDKKLSLVRANSFSVKDRAIWNTYCFVEPFLPVARSMALEKFIKTPVGFRRKFRQNFGTRSWTKSSKVAALRILFQRRRFTRREIHYASEFPTDEATSFVTFSLIVFRIFHFVSSFRFICDRRRDFDEYHIEVSEI